MPLNDFPKSQPMDHDNIIILTIAGTSYQIQSSLLSYAASMRHDFIHLLLEQLLLVVHGFTVWLVLKSTPWDFFLGRHHVDFFETFYGWKFLLNAAPHPASLREADTNRSHPHPPCFSLRRFWDSYDLIANVLEKSRRQSTKQVMHHQSRMCGSAFITDIHKDDDSNRYIQQICLAQMLFSSRLPVVRCDFAQIAVWDNIAQSKLDPIMVKSVTCWSCWIWWETMECCDEDLLSIFLSS